MNKTSKAKFSSNNSPVGWYLASYMERCLVAGTKSDDPNKRYTTWENTILIKARTPDEAYKKSIAKAKSNVTSYKNTFGDTVKWKFEGLTSLLPIYEDLEDGAEISYRDLSNNALKTNKKLIKSKKQLEAFK